MFFRRGESELVQRIEARIARLLNWPVENGEGMQVLHYRPGAEYKPHYDYFDPAESRARPPSSRGGQRVATLVMYLNEPARGGGTTFPDLGLEVAPQRGHAVFFAYDRPTPAPAPCTAARRCWRAKNGWPPNGCANANSHDGIDPQSAALAPPKTAAGQTARTTTVPALLFPAAARAQAREIGIGGSLPFLGADLWTAFELSWLNRGASRRWRLAHITMPCESTHIVESKSLKLYLNSFNNTAP
jgi:hypothetical protein